MNRIILADDQAIFRAGAARVLAVEDDMRIVGQCEDWAKLSGAMDSFPGTIILFSSGLKMEMDGFLERIAASGSRAVVVTENGEAFLPASTASLRGVISRNISGPQLVECVRTVGRGQQFVQQAHVVKMPAPDLVGERVRSRLTPKEMQIVALICQGCKNKDIAARLNTKEQVIKNYLRTIYDKTGVSDRLELALFTIHHRILAEAAAKAGTLLQMKSA